MMFPWSSRERNITGDYMQQRGMLNNQRTLVDILDEALQISDEVSEDIRTHAEQLSAQRATNNSEDEEDSSKSHSDQQRQQ